MIQCYYFPPTTLIISCWSYWCSSWQKHITSQASCLCFTIMLYKQSPLFLLSFLLLSHSIQANILQHFFFLARTEKMASTRTRNSLVRGKASWLSTCVKNACQLAWKMPLNLREKEVTHNTKDKCHVTWNRKQWSRELISHQNICRYKAIETNILLWGCWSYRVHLRGVIKYYISKFLVI